MRSTDELNPEPPFKPWGEKVVPEPKPKPEPKGEGPSGIVTDENGRMRTTTHKENPYL